MEREEGLMRYDIELAVSFTYYIYTDGMNRYFTYSYDFPRPLKLYGHLAIARIDYNQLW